MSHHDKRNSIVKLKIFILSLAFIFSFTQPAVSQQTAATLTGVVTDQNGAVIPGATVTVTSKSTGFQRTTTSNDDGVYVIANLSPDEYEVKISATNFETKASERPVELKVGQTVTLDALLKVGSTNTVVDLISEMPLVDTQTSKVDTVIDGREIETLPLNGRNFLELTLLTPGNAPAPNFDPTKINTVLISSAGQLGRGGNVMIDGTDNNDDVVGGALVNISQDAVAEFQVATNRFSAEYGRTGSTIINVVTKSGSNELHGSASFYERDRSLQGLPATFQRSGQEVPFDRQQYAFTLGGPVVKDKLFWFGAFEYRNQDGAVLVGTRDVASRTIPRSFASAPLDDLLLNGRLDYSLTEKDKLNFRYSFETADATNASTLNRSIGSGLQRQKGVNDFHSFMTSWTRILSPNIANEFSFSVNNFHNVTTPVTPSPQFTFPSIQDGASFRVPQETKQNRFQFSDSLTMIRGNHTLKFGGEFQRVDSSINLRVFQQGRIEFVEDFASADRNNDGRIDDNDLLFAVTLRSQFPDRPLIVNDVDSNHVAFFAQDDWRVKPNLTLNFGLRYELDTDVKNVSRFNEINPLVSQFLSGDRKLDGNNFAPRIGFNYSMLNDRLSVHGGYGIYYDRVVLQLQTLERGLDGRALPIVVRAGNALRDDRGRPAFLDQNGRFLPGAPTLQNPFSGFVLPGAGASGINIIDNDLQNPMVQQSNLGLQWEFARDYVVRADYLHNFGTHFIIGRTIGVVNNPVIGGPDRVVNLESSVNFFYDGLLLSFEKRFSNNFQFRSAYTLSKALNYANDDQIPFSNGPIDPNNLRREYGPTPNDQRHRFTFAGTVDLPFGFRLSPILTLASGVPTDILLPSGASRIPELQRNAGGRIFKTGAELNQFLQQINTSRTAADRLLLVPADARFSDNFSSLDSRLSKVFTFKERFRLEPMIEVFNLFNTTNILGVSNTNYSGFANVLETPNFGRPITTAGGVFGSGGPRAFQVAARFYF